MRKDPIRWATKVEIKLQAPPISYEKFSSQAQRFYGVRTLLAENALVSFYRHQHTNYDNLVSGIKKRWYCRSPSKDYLHHERQVQSRIACDKAINILRFRVNTLARREIGYLRAKIKVGIRG